MNRMKKLDASLLRVATYVAHAFQRFTGRTSIFLTRCAIYVLMLSIGSIALNYFWPMLYKDTPTWAMVASVILLPMMAFRTQWLGRVEDEFLHDGRAIPQTMLIGTPVDWVFRLGNVFYFLLLHSLVFGFVVMPSPHPVANFIAWLWSPAYVASDYFEAVMPLPPGPSAFQAWVSLFRQKPVEG